MTERIIIEKCSNRKNAVDHLPRYKPGPGAIRPMDNWLVGSDVIPASCHEFNANDNCTRRKTAT